MEETKQKQTETDCPLAQDGSQEDKIMTDGQDKDKTVFCNKFSSAEELEKAYNNLQKEFTKKCQQNAMLIKKFNELKDLSQANALQDNFQTQPKERDTETPSTNNTAENRLQYALPDWEEKVKAFLQQYPIANRFTGKIATILAQNDDLSCQGDCLELALLQVLQNENRSFEEIAEDQEFLKTYIFNNEKIKDVIIKEYLRNLNVNTPTVIAENGRTSICPPSRPKSIRDASGIVKNMLANRRI